MNIAIVGFGAAGKYYLEILKKNRNVKKIFVIDKNKISLQKNFIQIDIKKIQKENIKVDYAIICTPSGNHYEPTKFFLERKVNVLIEKPLALNLKEVLKLEKISKKFKKKLFVDYPFIFSGSTVLLLFFPLGKGTSIFSI